MTHPVTPKQTVARAEKQGTFCARIKDGTRTRKARTYEYIERLSNSPNSPTVCLNGFRYKRSVISYIR